jgi:hypothetical protein
MGALRTWRLIPPLLLAGLALVYLSASGGFEDPTSAEAPHLYGRLLLALAAAIIALTLWRARRGAALPDGENPHYRRALLIFLLVALFVAAIFAAGFYVATPLFLFLFLVLFARLKWWQALAGAGLALLFIWLVFGRFLGMAVYPGAFGY